MKTTNMNENAVKNGEQQLQDEVAKLQSELSPARDLWPGIEKAIGQNTNRNSQTSASKSAILAPMSWAASVVVAVLLTWTLITPEQAGFESPVNLVAAMEQDFAQQKQTLLVNLGTPDINELPEAMQAELSKLKSAQITISKALANDPNNSDLLNLLRWTQKQELDLLTQLYSPQWQTI